MPQDFSPYAQLVAALLPRAAGLSIFRPDGELSWTSDGTVAQALPGLVAQAAAKAVFDDEPGVRLQMGADEPVYLFWLRDANRKPSAVLSIRWRNVENDPRTFSYVHAMLRPVVECLRRELQLQAQLVAATGGQQAQQPARAADAEGDNADLRVLLSTTEATPARGDIAQLLGHVNAHLGCEFTALMMPERNVVVTSKAEGRAVDTSLLARAHRHLMSLAQLGKEAMLLNDTDSVPGVDLPLRVLVCTVRNFAGSPIAVMALFRSRQAPPFTRRDGLLGDLLARRAAAVIEARYDPLTGLFVRTAFETRVRALLAERPAAAWSFLYLDADRLHVINDQHGMRVGDLLLLQLGELVRSRLTPGGAAARVGGDRFAILLPASEADASAFAEGLRASTAELSLASVGLVGNAVLQSSLSIGVAPVDTRANDPLLALAAAESACRAAKRHGRNRVERHVPPGATTVVVADHTAALEAEVGAIHQILAGNRLSLHAQQIAPLPGNSASRPHFELLLRVRDEHGEPAGPGRFLADAARLQLLSQVDRWVLREALSLLKPRAALLAGGAVVLTINLSGQSLADAAFGTDLLAQLKDSGIDPRALCFEFSEAAVIEHLPAAEALMHALRTLGCHVALDNFGTGMASIVSLRSLPLSLLKIDGSFVRELLQDPRAEGLVKGMIELARSASIATVAECVETDEVRLGLAALGVDYGQGFAIARPVPLTDAIRDLSTWAAVARQGQGGDVELGEEDDTVSAALQEQLRRELLAQGVDPEELALHPGQAAG
jgi:diguanylate cyclase (GGDEF)-like protein